MDLWKEIGKVTLSILLVVILIFFVSKWLGWIPEDSGLKMPSFKDDSDKPKELSTDCSNPETQDFCECMREFFPDDEIVHGYAECIE